MRKLPVVAEESNREKQHQTVKDFQKLLLEHRAISPSPREAGAPNPFLAAQADCRAALFRSKPGPAS